MYSRKQTRPANVGTMLGQRRRRWVSIAPTLAERLVFPGTCPLQAANSRTTYSERV